MKGEVPPKIFNGFSTLEVDSASKNWADVEVYSALYSV